MDGSDKNVKQWADDLTRMDLSIQIKLVAKDVEFIKEVIKRSDKDKEAYATKEQVKNIEAAILRLEKSNETEGEKYVTKEEFNAKFSPVKSVVYGLVGIILTAVVIALVSIVIIRQ